MTTTLSPKIMGKKYVPQETLEDEKKFLNGVLGYEPLLCVNNTFQDVNDFLRNTKSSLRYHPPYCSSAYHYADRTLRSLKGRYQAISFVYDCNSKTRWYLYLGKDGHTTVRIAENCRDNKNEIGLIKLQNIEPLTL